MVDVILDTLLDGLKLLPFLFITFLLLECIEHKFGGKSREAIRRAGKLGPLVGGVLGAFPQCGFSVMATNMYATRIVSIGTLVAVYLSTSDEMLPIMISHGEGVGRILAILGIKALVGIIFGFAIDLVLRGRNKDEHSDIHHFCEEEHCHCESGVLKSAVKHTLNIFVFVLLASFILNAAFFYIGDDKIGSVFLNGSILAPFISSLVGLIPNCGASVAITELYLGGAISFGAAMSGLLTGSGVALLVLFKVNHKLKDNLIILATVYGIGAAVGIIIDLIGITI